MTVITSLTLVEGDPPIEVTAVVLNQNGNPISRPVTFSATGGISADPHGNSVGVSGTADGSLVATVDTLTATLPVTVAQAVPTTIQFSVP